VVDAFVAGENDSLERPLELRKDKNQLADPAGWLPCGKWILISLPTSSHIPARTYSL